MVELVFHRDGRQRRVWNYKGRTIEGYQNRDWHPSFRAWQGQENGFSKPVNERSTFIRKGREWERNKWGYVAIHSRPRVDFKSIEKKKFGGQCNRMSSIRQKRVCSGPKHTHVASLLIDNHEWKLFISLLKSSFFMKWNGEWSAFSRVQSWVDANWGEACILKTLPNRFYLVISPSEKDKEWILNRGPSIMGGKGFFIKDWKLNFDPKKEEIDAVPLWIGLCNLLHEYWGTETLKLIGDQLGGFLKANEALEDLLISLTEPNDLARDGKGDIPVEEKDPQGNGAGSEEEENEIRVCPNMEFLGIQKLILKKV
ncbi:hypothetical protein SUGI_0112910 [Cryptomeria japonica]|nr:hypothetical protein SUGI_0112910 [Cryptomeria japonica]